MPASTAVVVEATVAHDNAAGARHTISNIADAGKFDAGAKVTVSHVVAGALERTVGASLAVRHLATDDLVALATVEVVAGVTVIYHFVITLFAVGDVGTFERNALGAFHGEVFVAL